MATRLPRPLLVPRPAVRPQLWGEAFLSEVFLPKAELTGRAGPRGRISVVLPFLGAGPEIRGRESGFHRAAASNAFGIPASQEGALNWL